MEIDPDYGRQSWTVKLSLSETALLARVAEAVEDTMLIENTPPGLISTASYVIKSHNDCQSQPDKPAEVEFCGTDVTHGLFALLGASDILPVGTIADEDKQQIDGIKDRFIAEIDNRLDTNPKEQGFLLLQKARLLGNLANRGFHQSDRLLVA